jgi:hypothetical protein
MSFAQPPEHEERRASLLICYHGSLKLVFGTSISSRTPGLYVSKVAYRPLFIGYLYPKASPYPPSLVVSARGHTKSILLVSVTHATSTCWKICQGNNESIPRLPSRTTKRSVRVGISGNKERQWYEHPVLHARSNRQHESFKLVEHRFLSRWVMGPRSNPENLPITSSTTVE